MQRTAAQGGGRFKNPLEIDLAIWMADEIEGSNIQGRQIVAIFLGALRRADNDHRDLGSVLFEQAHHFPICAVNEPKAAKAGKDILLFCERGPHFFDSGGPQRVHSVSMEELAHALPNLRIDGRDDNAWSAGNGNFARTVM